MKTFGIILLIMLVIFGLGAKAFLDHASPEHEHSYGEWTTKTPATCTEAGVEHRVCECNDEETREIPATGHTYGEWETKTPANCTDAEVEARKCACGAEETREGDAANGHNFTEQVATEEYLATANCGAKATYYVSCACGAKGEETFEHGDVLPHNYYVAEVFMPSCTEGGYSTYKCRTCDDSYVGDELPANGHTYGAIVTAPTCTEKGNTRYQCTCGDYYIADEVAALGHNMVAMSDDTHHWTECDRYCCPEATEKVAHSASAISASYNGDAMQHVVAEAKDFTVTGTCACGKEFAVTEGIEVVNGTLVLGENTVTVKVGDASADVIINAAKFYQAVDGKIVADTHINSGNNGTSYGDRTELYIYNTGMYRVFFRFNFTNALNSQYYAEFGDEAVVQFTFTVTNGVDLTGLPVTFKSYLTSEVRSNADFSKLTWGNYNTTYTLGWGKDEDPNNTVSLLSGETVGNRATYADGKLVITVTLRELDGCIDENGNAIFVLLTTQSTVKPYIASMENTEYDIPAVQVIFSEDHTHAFVEKVVDDKYLVSSNCGEKAKYYVSCSCGEAGTKTFEHGEVIEHNYSDWTETQAPTCTVEGVQIKTCGNCGDTQTEAIPVIEHSYSAVVTPPTCTAEGYTTHTCSCGDTYTDNVVGKLPHTYGDWLHDESYHWQACSCGDVANKATHAGGEATETEQAVCDTCKQPYGGLASHVHNYNTEVTEPTCTAEGYTTYTCACGSTYTDNVVDAKGHSFGDWATKTPADCLNAEVEVRSCACGAEETQTGDAALNHNMETKFDETNHWTECSRCDEATEPVAHFGGTATETEKAICEDCGQPYGELKPAEKKEYAINGSVVYDTDINSGSKTKDRSQNVQIYLCSSSARGVVVINLKDIIDSEDFETFKSEGKFHITFTIAGNESDINNTKFMLQVANPTYTAKDGTTKYTASIPASAINWNSIHTADGDYYDALYLGDMHYIVGNKDSGKLLTQTDKVVYTQGANGEAGTVTYELTYDDIKDYICMDKDSEYYGQVVFKIRAKGSVDKASSTLYYASCETATPPTVKFVYEK